MTVIGGIALLFTILSANLPHDTFSAGDPGVKLIATRAAIAHPDRPLQIDPPLIGGTSARFVEPFFAPHASHLHAATSELFTLMSAPSLATFGIAGLYLLPGLGFLIALVGCAWLAVELDPRRSAALVAAVGAVCTPLLFYGLEFWEHAPAVGAAALGTALVVRPRTILRAATGGALLGAAVLLRPEGLWFAVSVGAGFLVLEKRPKSAAAAIAIGSCVAVVSLSTLYAAMHFKSIVALHISGNVIALRHGWFASRMALVGRWFLPSFRYIDVWSVAPAAVVAFLPLPPAARRAGRGFLAVTTVVFVLFVVATAPNDGGAQWGVRYLLFACVPLTILISDGLSWMVSDGRLRMLAAALVVASLWVDRTGYRNLRTSKTNYGRLVSFVETQSIRGELIVTDLWWLDQIAARLSDRRLFLYASEVEDGRALVELLERAHVPRAVIVSSPAESVASPMRWFEGTCFERRQVESTAERQLVATQVVDTCAAR